MIDPKIKDRALGAHLGLACGDALGATVEFMTKSEIAREYGIHRHIKGGGWLRLVPGQVTDDTEMSVWLGRAIIKSGGWDLTLVANCYAEWLCGVPADVGDTTRRGIRNYMIKGEIEAPLSETSAGNGAAMRNLPVILSTLGDDEAFVQLQPGAVAYHPQQPAVGRVRPVPRPDGPPPDPGRGHQGLSGRSQRPCGTAPGVPLRPLFRSVHRLHRRYDLDGVPLLFPDRQRRSLHRRDRSRLMLQI